jgi:hypothetical protein
MPIDHCADTMARDRLEALRLTERQPALLRRPHNRRAQRVLAAALR